MRGTDKIDNSAVEQLYGDSQDGFRLEEYVGHLLRKASQRATDIFQRVMSEHEVTPTQFAALIKLADEGEVSQNVLGRLTAMDPATILGVVSRLRRRDLVDSRLDPDDRRRILLCLTEKGRGLAADLRAIAGTVTLETLSPLTKSERRTFLRLLHKLA